MLCCYSDLTARIIRGKLEEEFDLEKGTLDSKEYKTPIKEAIDEAVVCPPACLWHTGVMAESVLNLPGVGHQAECNRKDTKTTPSPARPAAKKKANVKSEKASPTAGAKRKAKPEVEGTKSKKKGKTAKQPVRSCSLSC